MPDHPISQMIAPDVPACMKVIARHGDRLIRIRLPESLFGLFFGWLASAAFLSFPLGIASSILQEGSYFRFVVLAIFVAIWWWYSSRRPRLTINTAKGRYSIASHLSATFWKQLPQFTVVRELQDGVVALRLMIGTQLVAEHRAPPGHADENIFDGFIAKFGKPTTPQAPVISNELPAEEELPAPSVIAYTAPPLVLLVHGTYGATSPWTFPGSLLREAIAKHFYGAVQIDREPWSGQNSPTARRAGSHALKDRLQEILEKTPRKVVLICHSHGGNVALLARDLLSPQYQQSVWIITMATPFLGKGRWFVAPTTVDEIPDDSFIATGLGFGVIIGIGFLLFQLGFAVGTIADWLAPPLLISPMLLSWFLYFAILALLVYGGRRFLSWVDTLPVFSTTTARRFDQQSLAISYSQDEAFEAISVVVNLLALVYLGVFTGGRAILRLLMRWSPFEWIAVIAAIVFFLGLTSFMFSTVAAAIISAVVPRSLQPEWLTTLVSEVMRLAQIIFERAMPWIFSSAAFWGVVFAFVLGVIGLMALIRFTLYYLIGVADLARSREELFALIVGSLSVSMVPEGNAESKQITGSARFNHSAVYNDKEVIAEILKYMEQVIGGHEAMSVELPEQSTKAGGQTV